MVLILRKRPWRLHIFLNNGGLEIAKLPEFVQGNNLDKGVRHAGVLYKYILFGQTTVISAT